MVGRTATLARFITWLNKTARTAKPSAGEFPRYSDTKRQTDPAVLEDQISVIGPLMARAVVPHMLKQRWGRVINISMNYETMRRAGFSPYGPSKAALESETLIWAQELAGTGVTVNSLLPGGATETGMVPGDVAPHIRKRLLRPEVMVPPLLWLASEASTYLAAKPFRVQTSIRRCRRKGRRKSASTEVIVQPQKTRICAARVPAY